LVAAIRYRAVLPSVGEGLSSRHQVAKFDEYLIRQAMSAPMIKSNRPTAFLGMLFVLFLLFSWTMQARADVVLAEGQVSASITTELAFFRDDNGSQALADMLSRPATDWKQNGSQTFSHGYSNAHWWLRFDVSNPQKTPAHLLLELSYPVLDDIEVWILAPDGTLESHYRLGDKQPFSARLVQHRFFLIPLELAGDARRTVMLRLHSTSSMQAPLTLWKERAYYEQDQHVLLAEGLFFGGIGLLVIYSFFVFIALRERMYFYYVVFVLSLLAFLGALKGFAFQFAWPQATEWNDRVLMVSLSAMLLSGGLFTYRFLGLNAQSGRLQRIASFLIMLLTVFVVLSLFMGYGTLIQLLVVFGAVSCLFMLIVGAWRWHQGDHAARFYTLAWGFMLLGGVILALNKFQLLPQNFFTENAMQIGVAIEVFLLSIAIVDRINENRRLQISAHKEILAGERRTREAQFNALVAEREANELLEQRVSERTEELREANQKLEELSISDQLTGLRNRRYLDRLLIKESHRCHRYQHSLAVLMLDIDHFKRFNDSFGHDVGDECLRHVAAVLTKEMRTPIDHVARYGGEEFCVVMPETDLEGARIVAERIRKAIEDMDFKVDGRRVPVTASIGVVAMVPLEMDYGRELLKIADNRLYEAKAAGRNCVIAASTKPHEFDV
jgi:diguanylate cyclase (GGDEF)-like protein